MATRSTASRAGNGFLTRTQALDVLHVKPATLYTYVSRGLIRRLSTPGRKESLYYREDVERVRARHDARASEGVIAAAAVRYGEPIVPTSVTEITPEGPRYRNRSAIELAESGASFESTAELLWTGMLREQVVWQSQPPPQELARTARELAATGADHRNLHDLFAMLTTLTGMSQGAPEERVAETAAHLLAARQLIFTLTGCFGVLTRSGRYRVPRAGESVAEAIARSLEVAPDGKTLAALNAALTLAADHELNPATFVARIAASSEGDLHSCVAAAISTNAGTRIARGCDRLDDLLRDPAKWQNLPQRLAQRGASDLAGWGFSHPLYPAGDPRGACLMRRVEALKTRQPQLSRLLRDIEEVRKDYNLKPRFETSLVLLCLALRMPPGTAAGLYTLGRVAGWVAHIAEQRLAGFLIRPRAKFNG